MNEFHHPFKLVLWEGTDNQNFITQAKKSFSKKINNIKFLGERNDVDILLKESDIFLLISKFEALPLSVLEAMRCGLPVICTNVGGIPEVVDNGKSGFIVSKGSVSEILSALHQLRDMKTRQNFGLKGKEIFASKFHENKMLESIKEIYSSNW